MSDTQDAQAPPDVPQNGLVPSPETPTQPNLNLPPGTIQLPPAMVARLTRLLQEQPHVHDVLYAFIEGRGETGPFSLVLPVVLLMKPQTQPPGPGQGS